MAERYAGAEPFLAGLGPTYWAHLPLSIGHVKSLKLVDGLNCMVRISAEKRIDFIPVSKCRLVGCVVAVERRGNGSVVYVIDDGTGIIDCLYWVERDYDAFPCLTDDNKDDGILPIGEIVKVMGRVECVSIEGDEEWMIEEGRNCRVQTCTREIHASFVEPITAPRSTPFCMDREWQHWLQFSQTLDSGAVTNANDILGLLGPNIRQQVADRSNLPAAHDTTGSWRLFGTHCQCDLPYKEPLLYCHCIATPEPLDPLLRFRDGVLWRLLVMEKQVKAEHLCFQYCDIANDRELRKIAHEVVVEDGNVESRVSRLAIATFQALRQDGIISLLDVDTDTYLLVSRLKVLEPYMKATLSDDASKHRVKPTFLSEVPRARLQIVKRALQQGTFNLSTNFTRHQDSK